MTSECVFLTDILLSPNVAHVVKWSEELLIIQLQESFFLLFYM